MLGERKKKNRESNVKDILKPERCAITETPKSVFDFNTIFSIVAIEWLLAAGENNVNNNIINGLNCILHTFSLCLHKNLNWDWLQNTLRFISVQFLFVHTIHWPSLQIVLDFGQVCHVNWKMFTQKTPLRNQNEIVWPTVLRLFISKNILSMEFQVRISTWAQHHKKNDRLNFRSNGFSSI